MGRGALLVCALLPACLDAGLPTCGALTCPRGTACTPDGTRCVAPGQLAACAGKPELAPCAAPGISAGICAGGLCVRAGCGNAVVESDEVCDCGDGTQPFPHGCAAPNGGSANSSCSADCKSNQTCGNAIVDVDKGEGCDCGDGTRPRPAGCSGPTS